MKKNLTIFLLFALLLKMSQVAWTHVAWSIEITADEEFDERENEEEKKEYGIDDCILESSNKKEFIESELVYYSVLKLLKSSHFSSIITPPPEVRSHVRLSFLKLKGVR